MLSLLVSLAHAQEATKQSPPLIQTLMPMILMFAVFYFLLLRPQAKRAKAHADTLAALKRGDEVITAGGIYGRVEGLTDDFVTLEVSDGVKLKIVRKNIASKLKESTK
ncbi:MAG: preprotein translocase subunit YajC [Bdellovibrionales bacterium]|nr:preprotein translocase subunit YajC [Bdellovibrionales bacterium]